MSEFGASNRDVPKMLGELKAGPIRDLCEAIWLECSTLGRQVDELTTELDLVKRNGVQGQQSTGSSGYWRDPDPLTEAEQEAIEEQHLRPKVAPPVAI